MSVIHDRRGGRTIELFIPFEHQGKKFDVITLKPIMFDHVLRWQHGQFQSSLALLAALSGETENTLRLLRYPDVDRVLDAMMAMLPDQIRNDISNGVIPQGAPQPTAPLTNGLDLPAAAAPEEPFAGLSEK